MKKSFLTFLLMLFCLAGFAQQTVTGVILEEATSEPLAGAAVQVKDSQNGTIADADGRFSISVSPGQTLLISYIGLIPQEILIKEGMKDLTIKMLSDAVDINEVVVVGYGVQKKVNLTGSVSSVKGDVLERRPVADAVQSLQGMVPGLLVSNSDGGRPGGAGTLTLRGQGNLDNNAAPYVLVDGVEMSLTDVNPSDIENISVLKDAAACAIYGARAAYGVILVTTKKGEEGKTRINYQGTVGWSTPTVLPDMVNSYDFAQYWNAGVTNAGSPRLYSDEKLALLQQYINDPSSVDPWFELPANSNMNPAFENSESGVGNVNYFDLHYKNWAFKQNHNISLSGGGKAAQYYISGGYYSEDGILRYADMDYKRYNFAANVTSQLTSWMKLKVNTKFMHSDQNTPFGDGGISEGFYHSLARFRPTVSPVDPNGHFTELTMIPYLQSGTYTNTQRDNMNITAGLDIQPVKNWFIFFDYTYKLGNKEYEALNVSPLIYGADGVSTSKGVRAELGMSPDGKFTRSYDRTRYQSINLYTNYLFSLAEKHNFTVMAGFQEEDYEFSLMKNSITGLYSTSNPNVGMGTGDKTVIDTRNGWELALNYRGQIGSDIQYTIGGSLSDATSEVTEYANPTGTNPKENWYTGKKVGEIWGYRADGLIQTQEEADAYNEKYDLSFISGKPWTPGDVKYRDLNNDNKINNGTNTLDDMGDMTVIGNTTPRYQYTVNGSISWKGISLSMMFQGVGKRDWDPGTGAYFWGSGPYAQVTVFKEHLDFWSESNPGAYYPKPYIHTAGGVVPFRDKTMTTSDRYIQSGAYCRLKNLTISYDLPAIWTNKVGMQKVQVFFSGENLLTFTKLKGMFDPEAIYTKNDYTSEGGKNYPMNRVVSVGLVVNL